MNLIKKRGVWHVSIRTVSGRTKTITTRCRDRKQAIQVIRQAGLKDLELAARAGRLTNEAIGRITTGRRMTVLNALKPYRQWLAVVGASPRTIEHNISNALSWIRSTRIEQLPVAAITEHHISDFVNYPSSKRKLGTRKVLLASLRSFFSFLMAKGWCVGNPSALVRVNMDVLTHDQKEPRKKSPFTPEEFGRLLATIEERQNHYRNELGLAQQRLAAQGKPLSEAGAWGGKFKALEESAEELSARLKRIEFWRVAMILGRYTGLRLGDIVCLEWASLQNPRDLIVWTDKSNTRVQIPVHEQVIEAIRSIHRVDDVWCFPAERLSYLNLKRRSMFSVEFGRLCLRAGLLGHSFHDLRHTFLTECLNIGMSKTKIASLAGHASTKTTEGYLHVPRSAV